jgi:hypothetical protein
MVEWNQFPLSKHLTSRRLGDSSLRNNKDEKEGVFATFLLTLRALLRTFVIIGIRMPSLLGWTKVHDNDPQYRPKEQIEGGNEGE